MLTLASLKYHIVGSFTLLVIQKQMLFVIWISMIICLVLKFSIGDQIFISKSPINKYKYGDTSFNEAHSKPNTKYYWYSNQSKFITRSNCKNRALVNAKRLS